MSNSKPSGIDSGVALMEWQGGEPIRRTPAGRLEIQRRLVEMVQTGVLTLGQAHEAGLELPAEYSPRIAALHAIKQAVPTVNHISDAEAEQVAIDLIEAGWTPPDGWTP